LLQIHFESRFDGAKPGATCFTSLDCTDCRIEEPQPFSSDWFSHKFKGPGLRYEVGVNIQVGNIVWINGPFACGKFPDLKIAREAYTSAILKDEMTVADDTYRDCDYFIHPHGYPNSVELQKQIMSRHETINKRLKEFRVLSSPYPVAVITQLKIENGEPLYELLF